MISLYDQVKKIDCGWRSQRIDVQGQVISSDDITILLDLLQRHPSIRSLAFRGCGIEQDQVLRLAAGISQTGLITIQASAVRMTSVGAAAFASAIQSSPVKRLDLSQNEIGDEGCIRIADALRDSGLESLILCKTQITASAIAKLEEVLRTTATTLHILDVSRNNIGDSGAEALARVLPLTRLTCLLVDTINMTKVGYKALCEAVIRTPEMVEIVFSGNRMNGDLDIMKAIADMLTCSRLEYLSLNLCGIDPPLLAVLAEGVRASLSLRHLELKGNLRLTNDSMTDFIKHIGMHRALKTLELDLSGITLAKQKETKWKIQILHAERSLCLQALASVKTCPRLGLNSPVRLLPLDLFRFLGTFLPEPLCHPLLSTFEEPVEPVIALPPALPVVAVALPQLHAPAPAGIVVTQHVSHISGRA